MQIIMNPFDSVVHRLWRESFFDRN